MQEPQHQIAGAVVQAHEQLAAGARLHLAISHHAFNLRRDGVVERADGHQARLVFITHRQVQGEVDRAYQAELFHGALRPGDCRGLRGGG